MRPYPALIPAAAITRLQVSISRSTWARYSSGVDGVGDVAGLGELLHDVRKLQRPMHFGIEPVDDRPRRARRHHSPSHDMNSMPGTLSATVGASGISG